MNKISNLKEEVLEDKNKKLQGTTKDSVEKKSRSSKNTEEKKDKIDVTEVKVLQVKEVRFIYMLQP